MGLDFFYKFMEIYLGREANKGAHGQSQHRLDPGSVSFGSGLYM